MLPDIQRTIVALASAPRPAERAIVRLAGPETAGVLERLCQHLPEDFWLKKIPPVVRMRVLTARSAG